MGKQLAMWCYMTIRRKIKKEEAKKEEKVKDDNKKK